MKTFILFIVLGVCFCSEENESWVVHTKYGDVRGFWSDEFQYWSFVGIPYATPPIGDLRFKPPLPPTPWSTVLNATDDTIRCVQESDSEIIGSEDCLVINVYAPKAAETKLLPVLFFVHGGGFKDGTGFGLRPNILTRHDVIFVSINYRVGPLGYLCLGTNDVPGNAALRDIILALEWVNENIRNFGGDNKAITIEGFSAGSINIEAIFYSKAAEGLFQQVILESGSVLRNFAMSDNRLGLAKALGLNLDFVPVDDIGRLTKFLKKADAYDLVRESLKYQANDICIESRYTQWEPVITKSPTDSLESYEYQKIPILYAFNELEGAAFADNFYDSISDLNNNFEKFMPTDIVFANDSEQKVWIDKIKSLYFKNENVTNSSESARGYIDYLTDLRYFASIIRSSLYHSTDSIVFMMEFSYFGQLSRTTDFPEFKLSTHSDILAYVLGYRDDERTPSERDLEIRDFLSEIWSNFIKNGNPYSEDTYNQTTWPRFNREDQYYLWVQQNETSLHQRPYPERAQLWINMYGDYYKEPPRFCTPNTCSGC